MRDDLTRLIAVVLLTSGLMPPAASSAQTVTAESLEQWIRSGYELDWESGQPMPEEVRAVWSQLGSGGVGFGFRTFWGARGCSRLGPEHGPAVPGRRELREGARVVVTDRDVRILLLTFSATFAESAAAASRESPHSSSANSTQPPPPSSSLALLSGSSAIAGSRSNSITRRFSGV